LWGTCRSKRGTVFDSNKYTQLERHIFSDYRSYSTTAAAAAAAAAGRMDWRCEKEEKGEAQVYFLCRKKESSCYMATCLSRCWRWGISTSSITSSGGSSQDGRGFIYTHKFGWVTFIFFIHGRLHYSSRRLIFSSSVTTKLKKKKEA
jgi:hypothetical protein